MVFHRIRLSAIAVCCALSIGDSLADSPYFVGLGDFGSGRYDSHAGAVSGDGSIVVGVGSTYGLWDTGFYWTREEGLVSLGDMNDEGPDYSVAASISRDGTAIFGGAAKGESTIAFRWTKDGGMKPLGDLPGGQEYSFAAGCSGDGKVGVGESTSGRSGEYAESFRWSEEDGIHDLGKLGQYAARRSQDANYDGSIVLANVDQAAYWTKETGLVGLGWLPGGSQSLAQAITNDGTLIVGESWFDDGKRNGLQAFRWTQEEGMVGLGVLKPEGKVWQTIAFGVSDDGKTIVGRDTSSGSKAFIWTEELGMIDLKSYLENDMGLDMSGWLLAEAQGISADGKTIVGFGGQKGFPGQQGWVAHIPEPSTAALALALLVLIRRSRATRGYERII